LTKDVQNDTTRLIILLFIYRCEKIAKEHNREAVLHIIKTLVYLAPMTALGVWGANEFVLPPPPSAIQEYNRVRKEPKLGLSDQAEAIGALQGTYTYEGVMEGLFFDQPYRVQYTFHEQGSLTKEIRIGKNRFERTYTGESGFTVKESTLTYFETTEDNHQLFPVDGEQMVVLGSGERVSIFAFQWGIVLSP
tara:strand:- start:6294 stop:6869 length:576 start_codon:yes stop_codon:yes gene_type:complete